MNSPIQSRSDVLSHGHEEAALRVAARHRGNDLPQVPNTWAVAGAEVKSVARKDQSKDAQRDDLAEGSDDVSAQGDAVALDQLAFDFGDTSELAWLDGVSDAALSDYEAALSEATDMGQDRVGMLQTWGDDVLVAGIQPVPLIPVKPQMGESESVAAPPVSAVRTPVTVEGNGATGTGAKAVTEAGTHDAGVPTPSGSSAEAPRQSDVASAELASVAESEGPPVWIAGFGLLGLGGGGGGGGGAVGSPTPVTPMAPTVQFVLSGLISMGQVTDTTGLVIEAFKADGTRLSGNAVINSDGSFKIDVTDSYSGVVLIRLQDLNPGTNYNDEGTGGLKDLACDLRVMLNVSGTGTSTVALNPLTELAVRKFVGDSGYDVGSGEGHTLGSVTASQVLDVNTAIASALGLAGDVASNVPVTVDADGFSSGTPTAQAYGYALAAISGMEVNSGSSTSAILNVLAQGITVTGSTATMASSVVDAFVLGAAVSDAVPGNATGAAAALNAVLDGVGPAVTSVQVVAADGPLALGEQLQVKVQFNDEVQLDLSSGAPSVPLTLTWSNNGQHTGTATYVSGAGTSELIFGYVIDLAGLDNPSVNVAVAANAVDTGLAVLSDVLGNVAELSHTASAALFEVDTIAPTVSQVAAASAQGMQAGLLNTGDTVTFTLGLSEVVVVDTTNGSPVLNVQVGGQTVSALFDSVSSAGTEASFVLTITAGQLDVDGISIGANALVVGDSVWTDVAGNPLNITSSLVAPNATYKVDAVAPAAPTRPDLDAADDTGASISDNVTSRMSALTFTGVAEANATVVLFDDKNGNATLDATEELVRSSASALGAWSVDVSLSEGTHAIRALAIDSAGNPGVYASAVANVTIDNTAPTLKSFSTPEAAGAYQAGDTITLVATASETLEAGGRILVTLSSGEQVVLMAEGGNALLSGAYVITDTGFSGDLFVTGYQDVSGVAVKDVAGKALATVTVGENMGNIPAGTVKVDTVAPTVSAVSLVSAQGASGDWLSVGDVVTFSVKMSEVVFVGSSAIPTLALTLDTLGASSFGTANYVAGSGTDTLQFAYVVSDGDAARSGIAVAQNGLALNQATLRDAAGNDAHLDFDAVAANAAFKVMTTAPEVTAVSVPDQAMVVGDTVTVTLTVSDDGGVPYAALQGTVAGFAAGTLTRVDATTYTTTFTVSEGGSDVAADGQLAVSLTLVDAAGNTSALFTQAISAGVADSVDANTPQLTQVALASSAAEVVNHALNEGDQLSVKLTFSEAVFVSGTPRLPVSVGGVLSNLNYVSGSGTGVLTFSRAILPGETDVDGVTFLSNAVQLNGGRIFDAAGQDANLNHAALSAGGYIVDTTAPVVTAFYTDKPAGEYNDGGAQISVFAQMSEAVSNTVERRSELVVTLNTGAVVTLRPLDGDATTMVGTYAVGAGENTDSLAVASIAVAGVYDLAGNVIIEGSLPSNNLPASQANATERGAVVIDTTDPFTPAQMVLDAADNTGTPAHTASLSDTITRQTGDLSFSTTVEAGSTVRFYDGSTLLSTQVVVDGDWVQHIDLAEGSHQLRVTSTDVAGNTSAPSPNLNLVVDTTAPVVNAIEVSAGTGAVGGRLNAGDTVTVSLQMSEVIWLDMPVGGAKPTIQLDVGGSMLTATYSGGNGSDTLMFSALIDAALSDTDGISVVANSLLAGAAAITDVAGNVATLTHDASVVTGSPVLVDNTAPSVQAATLAGKLSSTGVLVWQDTVYVDVRFSEAVLVKDAATPTLALQIGSSLVDASYVSGSGTSTLRFAYQVSDGMVDANGVSIPTGSVSLAAVDDITDLAGNALGQANFTGSSDNAAYIVDATPPTVSSLSFVGATGMADGWINAGDTMQWQVTLSEAVNISGTPKLLLDVGGQDAYAVYDPNSGSQNLLFTITFSAGFEDRDGITIAANALRTDGGSLTDAQGNAVNLSHAAQPALSAYKVDTLNPHVVHITSTKADGFYKEGEQIQISALFNEDLAASGGVITAVLNTGESVILNSWDNHATLSGTYTVGATANSVDLAVTNISIGTAPIDLAGNTMTLQGEVAGLGLINLDAERAIVVDTVAPAAPSVPDLVIADDTGISNTDNHTKVATGTTMSGTAEAYATVTVFDDAGNDGLLTSVATEFLGEVVAAADGTWSLDLTKTLVDGAHLIRAYATDRAGNQGPVSDGVTLSVDTVKPTIAGISIPDVPMKVGDLVVATITVADDAGDLYYNVQGTINGFALGDLTKLNDTTYTATFTVTEGGQDVAAGNAIDVQGLSIDDSAGNRSDVLTTTIAQSADGIDANSPQVSSMAITSASGMANGYLNAGDVVNVTVVMNEDTVVTGTPQLALSMGSKVVYADYTASMPDAKHLVFSYTIVDENDADGIAIGADALVLTNGATLKDAAGNNAILSHAEVSANGAYLVDTVLPAQPVQVNLATDDDLGVSNVDNETNRTSALSFNGSAEGNSTVTVFDDANANDIADAGEVLATLTAAANGSWASELGLNEGSYAIRAVATDAAGNVSLASVALDLVVDTTAPTVTAVALGESVGLSNAFLNAGDQARIVLTMSEKVVVNTAAGVPTVTLDIGGTLVQAAYLSGSGSTSLVYSYTIPNTLNDANGISVVANSLGLHSGVITDVAGNAVVPANAAVTNDASQMVDTLAPSKPATMTLATADDTGFSGSDAVTATSSALSFSGSGESGATLALFADANGNGVFDTGEELGTTNIVGGLWSMDLDLAEGKYSLRSVVIDAAGNVSLVSDALAVDVDVTKPAQPGALALISSSDSGRSISDGVTQITSGLTFSLTAETGATIAIYEGSTQLATTVVNGNLRLNASLSEGEHTLYATATDAAGNVSVNGVLTTVTIDTAAPAQPGAISLDTADDLGIRNNDLLTSKSSGLSLSGSAEDNATIDVYDDANQNAQLDNGEKLGSTLATGGNWSLDVALTAGTHHIRALATDAAGNVSSTSDALALTVDITAPATSGFQAYDVASANGYSQGDVIRLVFSEAVQVSGLTLDHLALSSGHTLGTGALIQAQAPVDGMASSYWLTLGASPTIAAGDVLSLSASSVVDEAGNAASQTLEFMVPVAQAGTLRLATTAGAEALPSTTGSDHFVAVGLTVASQYASTDAVLGNGAVATAITRANSVSTVNLGDTFAGDAGFDVLSFYGTVDLQAGVTLSGLERLQIFGDVTMTASQLAQLNADGISIAGAGLGILRIVQGSGTGVTDISGIRIANLAQLDVGDGVSLVLSQDNLDQIAVVSGGSNAVEVQADVGSLDWTGVTVFGGVDAISATGGNLGSLNVQAGAVDGNGIMTSINASLTAANALVTASGLSGYNQTALLASDYAVLSGDAGAAHTLAAFGAAQHWLVGDSRSDTLMAGSGGDVLWGGVELQQDASVTNTLTGGAGNDVVISGNNIDNISTGAGNDYIDAGAGADIIRAGAGNDFIRSGDGTDVIQFEANLAGNGVDLFGAGVVGDVFDFSAMQTAGGFLDLITDGTTSVWNTTLAGLSDLANHSAAFIVLNDSPLGDASALKALLNNTAFDTIDKAGSRVVVWANTSGLVDMAFVKNADTLNDDSVSVDVFAHMLMTNSQTGSVFLSGLSDAHFVV